MTAQNPRFLLTALVLTSAAAQAQPDPPPAWSSARLSPAPAFTMPVAKTGPTGPAAQERAGTVQRLEHGALEHGRWTRLPNGRMLWRLELNPGNTDGIKLHFTNADLGAGRLWVHAGPEAPADLQSFTGKGPYGDGEFWSASIFRRTVALEFESEDGEASKLPFEIPEAARIWTVNPQESGRSVLGSCAVDATCHPVWRDSLASVAQLIQIQDGVVGGCTGTFLRGPSGRNLLLTAGHCIDKAERARFIEVFARVHAATCNGPEIIGAHRPKMTNLTLLATGWPAEDWTLMEMPNISESIDGRPAGYDPNPLTGNVSAVTIGHPSIRNAKIAFGQVVDRRGDEPELIWSPVQGRTHTGASGSPLFSVSQPTDVIGVLSGPERGLSPAIDVCTITERTRWTKFSHFYPKIRRWLEDRPPVAAAKAAMISPANNSTLPSSCATFQWTAGSGVLEYFIEAGKASGGTEYFSDTIGKALSKEICRLPTDGSQIYLKLWSLFAGSDWQANEYRYTASRPAQTTSFRATAVTDCNAPTSRLTWNMPGAGEVQIRVGSVSGTPMTGWMPEEGAETTGPWVKPGMAFILVNRANRELARATPDVPCGAVVTPPVSAFSFTASAVTNCANPVSTISWNVPGAGEVQVRVNSPTGTPLIGWSPEQGSTPTGPWVSRGMTFYLVDRSGRELARATPDVPCIKATMSATPVTECVRRTSMMSWSAPGAPTPLQIRLGAPNGALIAEGLAQTDTRAVTAFSPGQTFVLVDRLGAELARVEAPYEVDCSGSTSRFYSAGLPAAASQFANTVLAQGGTIRKIILTPVNNSFIVLYDRTGFGAEGIPSLLENALFEAASAKRFIKDVAISPNGAWVVLLDKNDVVSSGAPSALSLALGELAARDETLKDVEFQTSGSWLVVFGSNGYRSSGINAEVINALRAANSQRQSIDAVSFSPPDGAAAVSVFGGYQYSPYNLSSALVSRLNQLRSAQRRLTYASLGPNGSWVVGTDE